MACKKILVYYLWRKVMYIKMEKKEKKQSFLSHLEALRWAFVRCSIGIIICSAAAFIFSDFIFDEIIFAPKRGDFPTYRILSYFNEAVYTVTNLDLDLQNRKMEGQLSILIWTCLSFGIIAAFPLILFEFWKFIRPALYKKETKAGLIFLTSSTLLFFTGVLFGYYIIVPFSLKFLTEFSISTTIQNKFDLNSYFSLVRTTLLATGIVFNLPVIIYFLFRLNIVSTILLKEYRRYAYVIILVASAVITPPDILSQVVLVIPMFALYEVSIFLTKLGSVKPIIN